MDEAELSRTVETGLKSLLDEVTTREDVQRALDAYAAHVGIAALKLDEDAAVQCLVDGEIPLTFAYLPHLSGLVIGAPLPLEAASDDSVLRALLKANMSWDETGGGAFMIVPPAMDLMLCSLVPLAGDAGTLDRRIAAFVEIVRDWYREIDLYLDEPAAAEDRTFAAAAVLGNKA